MNSILLAPHNDDEALFASYVCLRYKPQVVVVTDSFIQYERGQQDITAHRRRDETRAACEVLGCVPVFVGIADTAKMNSITLKQILWQHMPERLDATVIFIPAQQGGNAWHDFVASVADTLTLSSFVVRYTTYASNAWFTPIWGFTELIPSPEERALKERALACYTSQHFQPHFAAALAARGEWISRLP